MPQPPESTPVRVVVAVHSREMRASLFLALNGLDGVAIVATASSTAELISFCRVLQPDVVLL